MNQMIKEMRKLLNMSKDQLASDLGVSCAVVDRWENDEIIPDKSAQLKLYTLCKKNDLDLTDFIVNREIQSSDETVLYHASRKGIKGKISPISRERCDFGKGFYMGTDPIQPLTLVCNEDKPVFYSFSMDLSELKVLEVSMDIDWAMLIAYYRGYLEKGRDSVLYEKYAHMADGYDVIVGLIANDRMYQVLTDFFEERITDRALLGSLSALKLGKQYVAITQKACDKISIISSRELSSLELMFLKETSIVRRHEGLSIADKAVKEHRRDGLYFDEILRGERND